MTNYPYDPELPFAVIVSRNVVARARDLYTANEISDLIFPADSDVVDTTPAPKIPADAEFIHWATPSNTQYYAKRLGHPNNKVWVQDSGRNYDEVDLIEVIGDAEVVVLKRA